MNYRRPLLGLLITGALATVFAVAVGQPANAAVFYTIQNYGSGKCIQPDPANSTSVGVQLMQESCNGSSEQKWSTNLLGNGNYQFTNQATGGCMDAHGPDADRTPVDTWPCSAISNQRWNVAPALPNALPTRIVSAIGGRCLDVSGGSLGDNALIQIYHCTNDNTAQAWLIQLA
jgi:hypothetical protein